MSNRNKPGRKPFGKGKTLFGNKGPGGDDDEDFDNDSDNNDDDDRSTTKKPVRRRDKTTGKTDQNPGGPDDDLESGNDDDDDDDDTGGRTSKDPKLRRSGKVKPSDIEAINDEDPVDSNDEEEGISDNPEKAAEQIQKSFAAVGLRPPAKLRFKKTNVSPSGEIIGEPVEEEVNAEFIGQVAEAIDEVDGKIQSMLNKVGSGADPARRRNAIFLNDEKAIKEFGEAAATVQNNPSLKTALKNAGMKVGGITVSVLAVIGGIALITAGSFLTIVSQAGGPAKIAAAISAQVIKGAETLNNKIDRKLDAAALKKANAVQLMRLLGINEKDAAEKGTIDQTSVATFNRFKLMAAANMKENEVGGEEA